MSSKTKGSELLRRYVSRVEETKKEEPMGHPCDSEIDKQLREESRTKEKRNPPKYNNVTTDPEWALLKKVEDAIDCFISARYSETRSLCVSVLEELRLDVLKSMSKNEKREIYIFSLEEALRKISLGDSEESVIESAIAAPMLDAIHELLWTDARRGDTVELTHKVLSELDDAWSQIRTLKEILAGYQDSCTPVLTRQEQEWIRQNRLAILAEQERNQALDELERKEQMLKDIRKMRDTVFDGEEKRSL